jgi:ATP-dependent DNA ligase
MLPMLAKRIDELPAGQTWIFEPKWDGFRALIFRDRDEILIQSRDAKSLNRYFPELLEPLNAQLPARCVLDGEIVVAKNDGLDFEELQLRIHPAASRVKLLSPAESAIGSLLLGLFDGSGALQHVGVCASFSQTKRQELGRFLAPYRHNALADHPWKSWAEPTSNDAMHRMPGGQSRWSHGRDLLWEPLRPS